MTKRVAVIDDNTTFLEAMKGFLAELGYEAQVYSEIDGAYRAVQADVPDVIILDIRITSSDTGWELLDVLRRNRHLRSVPVIVCSADLVQLQQRTDLLQRHRCAVLPKPFDVDDMLQVLQRVLADMAP